MTSQNPYDPGLADYRAASGQQIVKVAPLVFHQLDAIALVVAKPLFEDAPNVVRSRIISLTL